MLLAVVVTGCEASSSRTPSPSPSSPSRSPAASISAPVPSPPRSVSPSPSERVRLQGIELVADLSEEPAAWERVVFLPFGPTGDELGSELRKRYASVPVVPPSLAVDRDGSLWLLDFAKRRVVHYSAGGRLLDRFGGLDANRFEPYGQDLAFVGDDLYLLEEIHNVRGSLLRSVTRDGIGPRIPLTVDAEPIVMQNFVAPLPVLAGFGHAALDEHLEPPPGGGPMGDMEVDPATGESTIVDGYGLADGHRMGLELLPVGDGRRVRVTHSSGSVGTVLPLRVHVRPTATGPDLPASVGWFLVGATEHSIVVWVQLSPTRTRDSRRFGGGHWLFQAFDDGEPLVWEPIRTPPLSSTQWRHLTVGFDGSIYLMLATRNGMLILRRTD